MKNLGGDVPSRFENKTAQIRRLFRFLGYFGDRLATCRRFVPHSKIRGDAPAHNTSLLCSPPDNHLSMYRAQDNSDDDQISCSLPVPEYQLVNIRARTRRSAERGITKQVSSQTNGRRRSGAPRSVTDPGYMSRKIRKFRTDKFGT